MSLADAIVNIAPAVKEICVAQGAGFFRDNVLIELHPGHLETAESHGPFRCPSQATYGKKSMTPMKLTQAYPYPYADNPENPNSPTVALTVIKAKSDVTVTDFRFRCTLKGMQYIPALDLGEEGTYTADTKAEYVNLYKDNFKPDYCKGIAHTKLGFVFAHKEEDEDLSSHIINLDGIPMKDRTPSRDYPLYTSQGRVICGWYGKLNGWCEPSKDLNIGSMEPFSLKAGDEVVLIYRAFVEEKIPQLKVGADIAYPKFDMTGSIFYKSISIL